MKLPIKELFNYKTGNLGFGLLGLFYIFFPWFTLGAFDTTTAMFGLMFLTCGVIRAKSQATVLGGLFAAFLGMSYFFSNIAFIPAATAWMLVIIFFALSMILELGFVKFGPSAASAKAFIIVPLALLAFSLILALVGYNPMLRIDFTDLWVALNYVAVLLFCLFNVLSMAGWHVMKGKTNLWITVFAVFAVATAFMGAYGGTLFQW